MPQAGQTKVCFGIGTAKSLGSVSVQTAIGKIKFHDMPSNTPFLLCLRDMDILEEQFLNLPNFLVQKNEFVTIIRKWGHRWMLLEKNEVTITKNYTEQTTKLPECHLTELELRQLPRRFGHPSVKRSSKLLQRSGHEVDTAAIKRLT